MNPTGGLFQTLVAAMTEAAGNLEYENAFVDTIFWKHKPIVATPNTVLNVILPTVDESDVTDIGSGSLNITDTDHNSVGIPFDKHFSTSFKIPAWDQARTPQDLEETYLKPRLEALLRRVNRTIVAQCNTTSFGTGATPVAGYAKQSGATSGYFARSDINKCWTLMSNNGCPMRQKNNLFFLTGPTAFGKMLADGNFNNQYVVGDSAAIAAQQDAQLQFIYGGKPRYDQHFEADAAALGFTNQPGMLLHRYAIAAVTAQPAPSDDPAVKEQIIWLKNVLPVQMQVGFSLKDQGTIVHLHCYWGVKVARADYGSLIDSA